MARKPRRAMLASTLAAASLALLGSPASSPAATFGADLTAEPNVGFGCEWTPPVGLLQLPSGADTCTWWTTGTLTDTSQGHVVPYGGGTIARARVRVGPITGPMQFVVMRSLRHPESLADPACCFPVGASEVFTPAPNAVTEVPMNVATRHDTDPASGINNYDHIALSVLAPGVPMPARFSGDQSLSAPTGGGFYPHYTPGTERTTGMFGIVGFQVLINADIDPDDPGTGTPVGPTDLSGPLALAGGIATVRGKRAAIPFVCRSPEECAGLVRLQNRAAFEIAPSGRRRAVSSARKTYGKASFALPAGESKRVKVRLRKAGERLLKRKRRARVWANVKLSSGERFSDRVKLKRKKR